MAVQNEIIESGGEALAIECNVLNVESVKKAEKKIFETYGDYHVLINGAGGNHPKGVTSKEIFEITDLENIEITTF